MTYQLPSLPYAYDALEPHVDTRTMELHHGRRHAGYVERLNHVLQQCTDLEGLSLEEIISDIRVVPEELRQELRFNGGGHLNHSLFWHILGPGKGPKRPEGQLLRAFESTFGQIEAFRQEFARAALSRMGSGWAWLSLDNHAHLEILTTPNEDSPIMLGYRPILGLDLWEHAYYLKYPDRREEYIQAWWNVVHWDKVAELYVHFLEMVSRT
jgi:Fe-Mn family superoxide dismutase